MDERWPKIEMPIKHAAALREELQEGSGLLVAVALLGGEEAMLAFEVRKQRFLCLTSRRVARHVSGQHRISPLS